MVQLLLLHLFLVQGFEATANSVEEVDVGFVCVDVYAHRSDGGLDGFDVALARLLLNCGEDLGSNGGGLSGTCERRNTWIGIRILTGKILDEGPRVHAASVDTDIVRATALRNGLQTFCDSRFGVELVKREFVGKESVGLARTEHVEASFVSGEHSSRLAYGLEEISGCVALESCGITGNAINWGESSLAGYALP